MQKVLQKEFDRNIDIFDRYVKKNVAAVAAATVSAGPSSADGAAAAAAAAGGRVNNGAAAPAAGGWGATAGAGLARAAAPAPAAGASGGGSGGGGEEAGRLVASSAKGGAARGADGADAWALDVEESAPPKRLEEEEALDAEIQHLRKRRREVGEIRRDGGEWVWIHVGRTWVALRLGLGYQTLR